MTTPEPGVLITLSSIFQEVRQIKEQLGPMACDLKALRHTTEEDIDDLNKRVRVVEADQFPWGKIAGMVGVAGLVVAVVALFVR